MFSFKQAVIFLGLFAILGCDQKMKTVDIAIPTVDIAPPAQKTLKRAIYTEVLQLDPHFVQSAADAAPVRDLFAGLMAFDEKGKIQPALAKTWGSDDHQIWRFVLDEHASWSNGQQVTAADFVASWQRLADPQNSAPLAPYLAYMQIENAKEILAGEKTVQTLGVSALNANTLQIRLTKPNTQLPAMLAHVALLPSFQGEKPNEEALVTNGDYQLEKRIPNSLQLQAVENSANFTKVEYHAISSLQPTKPFDLIENPLPSQTTDLLALPRLCTYYYEFNFIHPELKKKEVRQAIKSMILSAHIPQQYGMENGSVLPKSMKVASDNQWNPVAVEQLLGQAGIQVTNPLKLTLTYDEQGQHAAIATQIVRTLGQSELFKVTPQAVSWEQLLTLRDQKQYQLSRAGWCADFADPAQFLWHFHSKSSDNKSHYHNRLVDAQLERLQSEPLSVAQRQQLIQSVAQQIDNDVAILPMFQYQRKVAVNSTVLGIDLNNDSEVIYSKHLYRMKPKD